MIPWGREGLNICKLETRKKMQQDEQARSSMNARRADQDSKMLFPTWPTIAVPSHNVGQGHLEPFQTQVIPGRDQILAAMASEGGSSSSNSFSGFQDLINGGAPLQFSYDYRGGHMLQVPAGLANFSSMDHKSVGDRLFQPVLMSRSALEMSKMTAQEIVEAKALAASKSHSEAERRRRERINNHLATLRSLLPNTTKTDKASLLAEVIDHVRELKRMVDDIGQASPVPSEADEVSLEYPDSSEEGRPVIRASLCCEDRPDLLSDLMKTLRSLRLRAVKAEIATLGSRVKNVLVVTSGGSQDPNDVSETPSASSIQEALKAVMERQNSGDLSPATSSGGNKRQRQVG